MALMSGGGDKARAPRHAATPAEPAPQRQQGTHTASPGPLYWQWLFGTMAPAHGHRRCAGGNGDEGNPLRKPLSGAATAVQMDGGAGARLGPDEVHRIAGAGTAGASARLPFLERIQASFGAHDVTSVQAHSDERAASASRILRANAFTAGDHVAFGKTPDLRVAAHEAAHVIQQRAGVQLDGGVGARGDAYERHADAVAERVLAGQSAEPLLDRVAPRGAPGERRGSRRPVQKAVQRDDRWIIPESGSAQVLLDFLVTLVRDTAKKTSKPDELIAGSHYLVLTETINLYDSTGKHRATYKFGPKDIILNPGYYIDEGGTEEGKPAPLKRWGSSDGHSAFHREYFKEGTDPKKLPSKMEDWFRPDDWKKLQGYVTSNKVQRLLVAIADYDEKGKVKGKDKGKLPGWAKDKVDAAKKRLDAPAPQPPDPSKTPSDTGAPDQKKATDTPAPAPRKPDKVVEWAAENGVFVNVWVDGALETIEVKQSQTPEDLEKAIRDAAEKLGKERDPSQSTGVVNGAKETGFVDDPEAPKGQSAVKSDAAAAGGKRKVNAPAYPASINNYGIDTTVVGATNRFSMELRYEAMTQGTGNMALFDEATNRMQPINFHWELLDVTKVAPEKIEKVAKSPGGSGEQATKAGGEWTDLQRKLKAMSEDTQADLENIAAGSPARMALDWPARAAWLQVVGLSNVVQLGGSLIGSYVSVLTQPLNERKIGFDRPGDFLIRCIATPVTGEDAKVVRASSVAVTPIRVMTVQQRATAANTAEDKAILDMEDQLKKTPPGPEHDELERKIAAARAAQTQNAAESTSSVLKALEAKIKVLGDLDDAEGKGLPRDQRTPEVRLLAAQLEMMSLSRADYRKQLEAQRDGVAAAQKRVSDFGEPLFRDSRDASNSRPHYRPSVTLASEENGQVIPMLMMLGESPDSVDGKRRYWLVDVTSASTQQKYEGKSAKKGHEGHEEAIRNAFVAFREDADYGRGTIAIKLPKTLETALGKPVRIEPEMRAAPGNRARVMQRLKDLATAAAIAGLVLTGPAALAVGAVAGVAGAVVAVDNMMRRSSGDRLHLDFETMMDIVSIVGGVAGVVGAAVGAVSTAARWVNTVKRIQGALHIFAYAQLGLSVIVIPITLEKKLAAIQKDFEDKKISAGERAARTAEAFLEAFKDGTIAIVSAAQLLNAAKAEPGAAAGEKPGAPGEKPALPGEKAGAPAEKPGAPENANSPHAEKPGAPGKEVPGKEPVVEAPGGGKSGVENERTAELQKSLGEFKDTVDLVENQARDDASVQVRFEDGRVVVSVGKQATAWHVKSHVETVRLLKKFEGPIGAVRRLISRIGSFLKLTPGFGTKGFEAKAEVKKLNAMKADLETMISRADERAQRLSGDPEIAKNAAEKAKMEQELARIEEQLAKYQKELGSYSPGKGFIAADLLQDNATLAKRFGLSEAQIEQIFKEVEGPGLTEGTVRDALSKRTSATDTATFGQLFKDLAAGGEKGAAARDFLGRASRIHAAEIKFDLAELHAAYERGDAVLDHGPLQAGKFLEDVVGGQYSLNDGRLGTGTAKGNLKESLISDNPSPQEMAANPDKKWASRPIDFVIIEKDGTYKMVLGQEHSGLSGGRASVFGAGELFVDKQGYVFKITNRSGHYLPSAENLNRAVKLMYERKILHLGRDVELKYY